MQKIISWIEETRKVGQDAIRKNLEICMKELEKGKVGSRTFSDLLEEMKELERDEALLCLFKKIIEDDTSIVENGK